MIRFLQGEKGVQESLFVQGSRVKTAGAPSAYWKLYAHLIEFDDPEAALELRPEAAAAGAGSEMPQAGKLGPMRRLGQ